MSSLSVQESVHSSANQWITPQEQLHRLALEAAGNRVYENQSKFAGVPDTLIDSVTKCATQSILKLSKLSDASNEVPSLSCLIVDRLMEPAPLPSILTNWYTARKKLGPLPKNIPPLPKNICQIINERCPIYSEKRKPDGTHYTIDDTHVLQLLCIEDGTINQFENDIVKPYGEKHYPKGKNPLQFKHFWHADRLEHGDIPFESTHWVLMTKDVLPKSRGQPFDVNFSRIDSLTKMAFGKYEFPSLQNTSRVLFLHKVATEESLYDGKGSVYTCTSVLEKESRLAIGGIGNTGMTVFSNLRQSFEIGVGAQMKFKDVDHWNFGD